MNSLLHSSKTKGLAKGVGRLALLARLGLGAALLIGAFLRLYGINHDLPFIYNTDEPTFVDTAERMLWGATLNPGWFGHPGTTVIYANACIYAVILKLGTYAGWFANLKEMRDYFYSDPTLFYLFPRALNALAGVAVIAATFLAGRLAFGLAAATAAALLVAVLPAQVLWSQQIRTDVLFTLFILLGAWQAAKIADGREMRHYLMAGALTGVAVATKYPGVVVAALVPFAHALAGPRWLADSWKVAFAGAAALAAAFLASPYLFLDFESVWRDVQKEMRPSHLGATGEGFLKNLWWYINDQLRNQFGLPILVLTLAGGLSVSTERRKAGMVLLLFPLLFLAFISSLSLRWDRWILPVQPFVAIFAAGGAAFVIKLALPRRSPLAQGGLLLALAVVASAPLAYQAWQNDRKLMGADTRTVARAWILENIPRGTPLLMEAYTPQLPREAYTLFGIKGGKIVEAESPFANSIPVFGNVGKLKSFQELKRVQYVVLGSFQGRFEREASQYARQLHAYKRLLAVSDIVYSLDGVDKAIKGPPIRVLRIDQGALGRHSATIRRTDLLPQLPGTPR